jgi:hypothetical protein
MKLLTKQKERFISEVLALETEDAASAGRIAYMARALVMATLPHSKPKEHWFERQNGHYTLSMIANPRFGLPYGSLPRLLLAWMTTEAVRTKSPSLDLGNTLAKFLSTLQLSRQGGKRGDITRIREQMLRLFTTNVSCIFRDDNQGICSGDQFNIARSFNLWWDPVKTQEDKLLPNSCVTLARDFFDELISCPIPIDFGAFQALRRSPLQLDIYTWLTYRFSFLKRETIISWPLLKMQFGADYADNDQGTRDFRGKFLKALKAVLFVYQKAKIEATKEGVTLLPSATHVKKKNKRMPVDKLVSAESYAR